MKNWFDFLKRTYLQINQLTNAKYEKSLLSTKVNLIFFYRYGSHEYQHVSATSAKKFVCCAMEKHVFKGPAKNWRKKLQRDISAIFVQSLRSSLSLFTRFFNSRKITPLAAKNYCLPEYKLIVLPSTIAFPFFFPSTFSLFFPKIPWIFLFRHSIFFYVYVCVCVFFF